VLLPGGLATMAGAARTPAADAPGQRIFGSPGFAGAVLKKQITDIIAKPEYWRTFHKFGFGRIEPGTSPTPFAPQTFPPNWVRSVVVTCYVPPAGSWGPGGPGTASGVPVFEPGTEVRRGPYPGYIVSTTPVRVICPGSEAGKVVELRVTERVATLGYPTILSMTWQDIYRIVPAVDGPVDFPGVIVATGRVPPTPPPPGCVVHRASAGAAHIIDRVRRTDRLRRVCGRKLDRVADDGLLRELSGWAAAGDCG
jgi:hypothetical protein